MLKSKSRLLFPDFEKRNAGNASFGIQKVIQTLFSLT